MPKYSNKPCARCGKMMLHAYCSTRYCKACAPLVRSDHAIIRLAKQRSKRVLATIVSVERAAKAAGMSYGQYAARYDPPKARPKPQKERYHDL